MNLLTVLFFFLAFIFLIIKIYPLFRRVEISQIPALSRFTAKIPSVKKAVGWTVVAVALVVLVIGIAQSDFLRGGTITSDASTQHGLGNWKSEDAWTEDGHFVIPPEGEMHDEVSCLTTELILYSPRPEGERGKVEISFEDLYDYQGNYECSYKRDAKFIFPLEKKGVGAGEVKFGNSLEDVKLDWKYDQTSESYKGNYLAVKTGKETLSCYYGVSGRFSQYSVNLPLAYQVRDKKRPVLITIRNLGTENLLIDETQIKTKPLNWLTSIRRSVVARIKN